MHVLFAHDHVFHRDAAGILYSSGKLPYATWQRYLKAFTHVVVAARIKDLAAGAAPAGLDVSSGPNVSFVQVPSLSSPVAAVMSRARARAVMTDAVSTVDAVIARLPSEVGMMAIEAADRSQTPWAAEVVGCAWDALWNYGNWKGRVYAPFAWLRTKRTVARAPFALYVSDTFLQRRYPSPGRQVACSNVELPELDAAVLPARLDAIDRRGPAFVIGLIGSLSTAYKGIDTVLHALHAIKGRIPQVEFRILGGGDGRRWDALARQLGVHEQTVFSGTRSGGAAVYEWLDETDLYVQPSRQEGLPRSLVEAMSRACPALGSRAGGIPELLDADSLIDPGDHRALSEKILRAWRDKEWRRQQARRNVAIAGRYTNRLLNQRREAFWLEFREFAAARRPPLDRSQGRAAQA